ncbi:MAG: hypothetical protein LUC24_05455 [Bacteroidales bacterium]|nr:hypothetical protein [Bacteroidales bacterium]
MKIGKTIVNVLKATMRGELLLSLRVDKLLIYIIYFFVCACLTIFAYLKMDSTMVRMEKNKETLEVLQIEHAQKTLELARFNRMSTVEEKLREQGSDVKMPEHPARKIKK